MDPQNRQLAEQIKALKHSPYWQTLETIRDLLVSDLKNKLFLPARIELVDGKKVSVPLTLEPNLNAILANRAGKVEGILQLFALLEEYSQLSLDK